MPQNLKRFEQRRPQFPVLPSGVLDKHLERRDLSLYLAGSRVPLAHLVREFQHGELRGSASVLLREDIVLAFFGLQIGVDFGLIGVVVDEQQLTRATERECVLYSHNASDFYRLHTEWLSTGREHAGMILAPQPRFSIGEQLRRTLRIRGAEGLVSPRGFG